MSAFAAQVVPGSSDWLTRRNFVIHDRSAALTSENNGQLDAITDSPPSNGYQLDYKFPSLINIKRDPDDVTDFFRSASRPPTKVTSTFECTSDALPSHRTLPSDEFRQRRNWLAANGYHQDVEANNDYVTPDVACNSRSRLPGVDELIKFQNDVISLRSNAEANRRRRIAADEPVDLSLIEQSNLNGSYLPGWAANTHIARETKDSFQKVLSIYQANEEQLQAMRRRDHGEALIREQRLVVPGPPLQSPAVLMPTRDVPDTDDIDEHYQPRRLMFADRMYALKHGNQRGDVRCSRPYDIDQNNLIRTKFEPECRRSPAAELPRGSMSSNQSPVNGEKRRPWPLESPAESLWRRRHHQRQTDIDDSSRSPPSDALPGARDAINIRGGMLVGNVGVGVEADRFHVGNNNGDGRCPMSELIQLYDVNMTSRAANGSQQNGSDARPTVVTRRTADSNDDVMTSPERSACGALDEDSMNSGAKKYVCHICPFVGEEKESFDSHMKIHFDHWCPSCNYSSRTEGRLRCHIKMFHSKPEGAGNGDGSNKKRQKNKITCRHCDFTTKIKEDLWLHMRQHIPAEKMLECPRCSFVTDLKHHLEYHLRSSHIGSKPYKCDKCTYRCFNQSMLNSHAKSHTNVYQFRCLNCTFAAKYCHALKVHIRRYGHQAAPVLNEDGSQPTDGSGDFALISRRGRPRGPRGHREMPRFRSVRPRNQSLEHGLPAMPGSEFDETIPRTSSNTHNNFPEMAADQMFYSNVAAPMNVNRLEGGLCDLVPGVLPSFSKIAATRPASNGLQPHLQFSSDLGCQAFPDRRDVVVMPGVTSPRYSLPPQSIRDAEIDKYLERCRRYRRAALDEMETYSVESLRGPEVVQPQSGPVQAVYSVGMEVPSPEPERAQCGDLPLDLTLATRPKMEMIESRSKTPGNSRVDEDGRDAASSPDDYDHVFRRRRHFRDWFKLQSSRSDTQTNFDESRPPSHQQQQPSGDSEDVLKAINHVPDTDSLGRSARSSKSEELGEVDSPPMAGDDRSMETLDTFARKLVTDSSSLSSPSVSFEDDRSRSRSPCRDNAAVDEAGSPWVASGRYQCSHCEIDFHGSRTLHAIHMGYHSNEDPFQCNVCGERTKDRVAFFIHLARVAHN